MAEFTDEMEEFLNDLMAEDDDENEESDDEK
jgi:hypothetical protein